MASPKTIVITVPRPITDIPRMKSFLTPLSRSAPVKRPISMQSREFIQLVKEEIKDGHRVDEDEETKPPRKRQKLDHLNDDQKLLRRKMKNRVAAQSARDRKKVRMDDLEGQVACLTQRVSELVSITEVLTQHNARLEKESSIMRKKMSQCSCHLGARTINVTQSKPVSINLKSVNTKSSKVVPPIVENKVVATIKAPVSSTTERSAEPPQPRAVVLAAVVRALFVAALCSPLGKEQSVQDIKELSNLTTMERQKLVENVKAHLTKLRPSGLQLETLPSWKGHHQPPWRIKVGLDP